MSICAARNDQNDHCKRGYDCILLLICAAKDGQNGYCKWWYDCIIDIDLCCNNMAKMVIASIDATHRSML